MSVGPPHCQAEMYDGRVTCCPLVSHGEYADGTDKRQTDGRQTITLRFPLDAARVMSTSSQTRNFADFSTCSFSQLQFYQQLDVVSL